jgi:serine/threonine protein phosphatase PrpC
LKHVVEGKKARAYLFNRNQSTADANSDDVLRMNSDEVFDVVTSQQVNLLVESKNNENAEQLADFNLNVEKDIILCKSRYLS